MAVTQQADPRTFRPRWPDHTTIDPEAAWLGYDPGADELVLDFSSAPRPAINVPIDTPVRDYVFLRVDEASDAVVGVQVDGLLIGASVLHSGWRTLAGVPNREAVAGFLTDVANLFHRYGAGSDVAEARGPEG